MRRQFLSQKAQCGEDAVAGISGRNVAILFPNAQGSQSKAGGRNACDDTAVARANIGAVLHQSGLRIRLLPEELEVGFLNFLEQLVVFTRQCRSGSEYFSRGN